MLHTAKSRRVHCTVSHNPLNGRLFVSDFARLGNRAAFFIDEVCKKDHSSVELFSMFNVIKWLHYWREAG